jgi:hypothetical protein
MENPTPHDQDDSRSMSEKSVSDQGLTKQTTTNSATHVNGQMYDSTPTTVRGEQSTGTPAMLPPPRPNFKATPTSAQPSSHSQQDSNQDLPVASSEKKRGSGRQRTTSSKDPTQETTKPVTRKRSHEEIDRRPAAEDSDDQDDESHDEEANDEFKEPANAISPFDWEGLQQRYHDQMRHCGQQEQELYRQFEELCSVSFHNHIRHQSTDSPSISTCGPILVPATKRIVASSGKHIHAMFRAKY